MNKNVKSMIMSALFVAIGITLPMAFHAFGQQAGRMFLPMHIPVLMCGLFLGWKYGLAVGILTPLLSYFFTGMPPAPVLPGMVFELAAYGAVAGLLIRIIRTEDTYANIHLSLLGAMLVGRILMGVLNALIFSVGEYSLQIWLTTAFVTALPGIVIQIILIPMIVKAVNVGIRHQNGG